MDVNAAQELNKGDTLLAVGRTLTRPDGSVIDISGATEVRFNMAHDVTGEMKVDDQPAVIVDGPGGQVEYRWRDVDVDTAGSYWGWFVVIAAGKSEAIPVGRKWPILIYEPN